jgi:hypothetical protein
MVTTMACAAVTGGPDFGIWLAAFPAIANTTAHAHKRSLIPCPFAEQYGQNSFSWGAAKAALRRSRYSLGTASSSHEVPPPPPFRAICGKRGAKYLMRDSLNVLRGAHDSSCSLLHCTRRVKSPAVEFGSIQQVEIERGPISMQRQSFGVAGCNAKLPPRLLPPRETSPWVFWMRSEI